MWNEETQRMNIESHKEKKENEVDIDEQKEVYKATKERQQDQLLWF